LHCWFFIAIGFLYRFSCIAFTLGLTWVFLLDQTQYLKHFYLVTLIGMSLTEPLPAITFRRLFEDGITASE
jgi:hypothetical protein